MTALNTLRMLTTRLRFVYGPGDRNANRQYNAATQRTRAAVNGLAAANAKLAATQHAVNSAFAGSVKALGGYAAILGLAFGGREIVQAADQMDELNNRLRAVVGNTENIEDLRRELTRLSVTNFSNIEDTAQIFQRFKIGTEDVGASTDEILKFTDSVQKAAALSGAKAQETNNALIQFAQGIASNRFSGEELRSVSEQLPTLLRVLKRDLDLTTGELRELAFAGGLTSDVIFTAFDNQRETIVKEFSRIQVTQQKAAQNLRTGLFTFFGKFGQGLGINRVLADLYQGIAEGLVALEGAAFRIGLAFRGAARMLFDFQDAVFSVFNPIFGAVGNSGLGDLLKTLRDFFSVFNTMRASGKSAGEAFRESLALFFEPGTAKAIERIAQSLVLVGKVLLLISAAKIVKGLAMGIGGILGIFANSRGGGKGLLKVVAAFFSMKKALMGIKAVGMLLMRAVFSPITGVILALQVAFAAWNKENSNLKALWEKLAALWNGGPNGIGLGAVFDFLADK
ncbi:MAG: tape measure protein, partial [Sphingomonadales bacterium]